MKQYTAIWALPLEPSIPTSTQTLPKLNTQTLKDTILLFIVFGASWRKPARLFLGHLGGIGRSFGSFWRSFGPLGGLSICLQQMTKKMTQMTQMTSKMTSNHLLIFSPISQWHEVDRPAKSELCINLRASALYQCAF